MPVPEQLRLYGRTDLLIAVGDQQPPTNNPPWNAATRHRQVTRTITLHFTHGWSCGDWRSAGDGWFGATFNIDLDGTLYQCEEMIVRTNHVGGNPDFTDEFGFVNHTSIGIELARFGRIRLNATGQGYTVDPGNYNIGFQVVANPPDECDYSQVSNNPGPRRFSLLKMRGEATLRANAAGQNRYHLKIATFDDDRNDERADFPLDVLFTEEQYRTLVQWAKCMCEMHRIPKSFLRHPSTGHEHPWIDVTDLIEIGQAQARVNENKERVRAFQGIIGHNNMQRDRADPGASIDYYRIKRGISDEFWYPVDLDDTERAIDYLDTNNSANYMAMREYKSAERLADYYAAVEGGTGGYFPIGLNRLWHGGVHLPSGASARPVYAMANGRIVAARVANGTVTSGGQTVELPYSRCFVLIRHEVHSQDNGDEISYAAESTITVYSLYMHLAPFEIPEGPFQVDYDAYPIWFNHYMIDHRNDNPAPAAPRNGAVFYPDQPVLLSDRIGMTGSYVIGIENDTPTYGPTLHLEVFTAADISTLARSPWAQAANRVEDLTEDLVCNLELLDAWLIDSGAPGIDNADIRAGLVGMREIAVRHRSEWSLENRDQLSLEISAGNPPQRIPTAEVVSQEQWEREIQPLCFHTEMAGDDGADEEVIGAFLESPIVWHVHPFVFMSWMNARVARHETILRSQDKRRSVVSTVTVQQGYVRTFVNPVPMAPPASGYPEVAWGDNTYEVGVNHLADPTALATGPQTITCFHLRLLDLLDQINDRPHGLTVVVSYAAAAQSAHAARHLQGHAADVRPGNGVTAAQWQTFYVSVTRALTYIRGRDGDGTVAAAMLQDPDGTTRLQAQETADSAEWLRRLQAANSAADPALTATDPAFPNLLDALGQMRLHLYVP